LETKEVASTSRKGEQQKFLFFLKTKQAVGEVKDILLVVLDLTKIFGL
jgi:hypothetical protein